MPTIDHYRINAPALATRYFAPNGFWFLPSNATSADLFWQSDGTVCNVVIENYDINNGVVRSSLTLNGINSGHFITSAGHNGSLYFATAFRLTAGAPGWCEIWVGGYTGTPYPLDRRRRSGVWVVQDGSLIKYRRSGVWSRVQQRLEWRSGAWANPI